MINTVTRFLLFTCMAIALLGGCSVKLQIALFNNAGEPITVVQGNKVFVIDAGKSYQFDYPADAENWSVYLDTAQCRYVYEVPRTFDHIERSPPGEHTPLKVQLEKDFTIFLLPRSASAIGAVSSLGRIQVDGFPLHPASKKCR